MVRIGRCLEVVACVVTGLMPLLPVQAQDRSDAAVARSERSSLREERADRGMRVLARKGTVWDLTIGAAYTDAEDGSHAFNVPFEVVARWDGSPFKLRFYGDGPTRISTDGTSASGLADVTALGSYAYALAGSKLVFAAGATLPTHGEVGGKHVKPRLSATWAGDLTAELHARMGLGAVRVGGNIAPGQSRIGKSLTATLGADVAWGPFNSAVVQLIRAQRSGASGSTTLVGALDMALSESSTISTSLVRGLTRGSKDATLGVDWSHTF